MYLIVKEIKQSDPPPTKEEVENRKKLLILLKKLNINISSYST